MEYKVIKSDNIKKFTEMVNQALQEGWRLLGGVSAYSEHVSEYYSNTHYAQAVVRGE